MTKVVYLFSRLLQVVSVLGNLLGLIIILLDVAGKMETEGVWLVSIFLFMVCYLIGLVYRKIDECLRHTPYIEIDYGYF